MAHWSRRRSWRNWLQSDGERKAKDKPRKIAGYELDMDPLRMKRAEQLTTNRSHLVDAADRLRNTGEGFCLAAATLVDAAIEMIDDGLSNLCEEKPRNSPTDPEIDYLNEL